MFTGFYRQYDQLNSFSGVRLDNLTFIDQDFLTVTGLDPYPAHQFDNDLISNLSKKRGLIMNTSKSEDVWNFPIYEDRVCSRSDNENLDFSKMPLKVLQSASNKINRILSQIQEIDSLKFKTYGSSLKINISDESLASFYSGVLNFFNKKNNQDEILEELQDEDINITQEQWLEVTNAISSKNNDAKEIRPQDFIGPRKKINLIITTLAKIGAVKLKTNLTPVVVFHEVSHGAEGSYAVTNDFDSRKKTYEMVLFQNEDGKTVDGYWTDSVLSRPSYTVRPDMKKISILEPLEDLLRMMQDCNNDPQLNTAIEKLKNRQFESSEVGE